MPTFKRFYSIKIQTSDSQKEITQLDYGLTYLTADMQKAIHDGMDLYDGCFVLFIGLSGTRLQDYKQNLAITLEENNIKGISTIAKQLTNDEIIAITYYGYEERVNIFNNEQEWRKWRANLATDKERRELDNLRLNWQAQAKFAMYSSDALIEAVAILNKLEEHFIAALEEFKELGHRMLEEQQKNYFNYLADFKRTIDAEKKILSHAMLARLQLACNNAAATYDDVILETEKCLGKLGIQLETQFPIKMPRHKLTDITIKYFYSYIQTNGDDNVKNGLKALKWFDEKNSSLKLVPIQSDSNIQFVPQSLSKYVPKKPRKPAWIFIGHNKRHEFFQNQSQSLLDLAALSTLPIEVNDRENPGDSLSWQKLQQQEQFIHQSVNTADGNIIKGWRSLFQGTTNKFFREWRDKIEAQHLIVLDKKLTYLEQYSALLPKGPTLKHELDETIFADKTIDDLCKMLHELESNINTALLPLKDRRIHLKAKQMAISSKYEIKKMQSEMDIVAAEIARFEAIKSRYENVDKELMTLINKDIEVQANNITTQEIKKTFDELASNKISNDLAYDQIFNYYNILPPHKKQLFIEKNSQNIEAIHARLQKNLEIFFGKLQCNEVSESDLSLISQHMRIIQNLLCISEQTKLKSTMDQFIANYTQYIENQPVEMLSRHQESFSRLNNILDKVMPVENHGKYKLAVCQLDAKLNPSVKDPVMEARLEASRLQLEESQAGLRDAQLKLRDAEERLKRAQASELKHVANSVDSDDSDSKILNELRAFNAANREFQVSVVGSEVHKIEITPTEFTEQSKEITSMKTEETSKIEDTNSEKEQEVENSSVMLAKSSEEIVKAKSIEADANLRLARAKSSYAKMLAQQNTGRNNSSSSDEESESSSDDMLLLSFLRDQADTSFTKNNIFEEDTEKAGVKLNRMIPS